LAAVSYLNVRVGAVARHIMQAVAWCDSMAVDWEAGVVESDPERTEPPTPDEWVPVSVPGRPDRFAGADAVAYRARFADPRQSDAQRAVLDLAGTYAHARVWVNGESLGAHDAYFAPASFEFQPTAETELVVVCRAPEDRFGGVYETDLVPDERAVPGIWWHVGVRVRPATFLADLSVSPRVDDGEAYVDAAVSVDATEPVDDRVTLSLRPEGFRGGGAMERVPVQADAGERVTITQSVRVRDAERWWPRALGDQHRYTLRAKLGDDAISETTGIVAVERDDDHLVVNGERLPGRAVTVLPSAADPETLVERAVDANATVVRPHGHVPSRAFHEAADDAGLLVWQDLPLAGPGEFDVDRGQALARTLASSLAAHPSVGCYTVHSGPTAPFGDPVGDGFLSRLRFRWRTRRREYDRADADAVAEALDGEVVYPVAGHLGTGADAVDCFAGWDVGSPGAIEWLLERYPAATRVVAGFGAAALAEGAARDEDDGFDWATHDVRVGSDDVAASQAYQARTLKTVAEALRRAERPLVSACCLQDAYPVGGMGVLAADGTEKPGFGALAESYQPVVPTLDGPPDAATGVVVHNDTASVVEGEVAWRADGEEDSTTVRVDPHSRVPVPEASVSASADEVVLALDLGDRTVTNRYGREE
jgi:beta-mannosidase